MKFIVQEGTFKRSKHIFIFTGIFLIVLFGYQLYDHLQTNEFNSTFLGDWDKVLGVGIGVFLIFRSSVFTLRSRDLFIEITNASVKYRTDRRGPIKKVNRRDIDKLVIKKGQVLLHTKDSKAITLIDFDEFRIRDSKKEAIIEGLKQSLNQ